MTRTSIRKTFAIPVERIKGGWIELSNVEMFFQQLIDSLQLVASDCDTQIAVFPHFVGENVPDEIALYYYDAFLLADQILAAGLIHEPAMVKLQALDEHLRQMSKSKNPEVWTLDALRSRPEWANARLKAQDILEELGAPLLRPQSFRLSD